MREINCLDKGYVRLVDHMGDDLSIVRAARVSHDAVWRTGEDAGKDEKLIRYMLENGHTSPFEHVALTFDVKAPIFVYRQWHRHRTWSYNEMSARYTELPDEFYIPDWAIIGTQSVSNRQGRDINREELGRAVEVAAYSASCTSAFEQYRKLLAAGWPRELARMCLPVSTYSSMFATVDLHNLLHFLKLRLHPHAQYEIRVYAEAMKELIKQVAPITLAIWDEARSA